MKKAIHWRSFLCLGEGEMDALAVFVRDHSDGQLLSWARQLAAAVCFSVNVAKVEEIALKQGILPARYQRKPPGYLCR